MALNGNKNTDRNSLFRVNRQFMRNRRATVGDVGDPFLVDGNRVDKFSRVPPHVRERIREQRGRRIQFEINARPEDALFARNSTN